jgi:beta-N-acetylhexosaminidase
LVATAEPAWYREAVVAAGRISVGELLMVGIPGPTLDGRTRARLRELDPAGVILFRRNARNPAQLRRLCTELRRGRPRLLIGIDHEGGRVNRLPPPFTAFPPAGNIGQVGSPRLAFAVGQAMGKELASVGIDIDFAPVLDVLTHPRNRVIGDRAFADDPELVAKLGLAFARGLQAGGVLACGKHFPGHGGTRGDSHVLLPRVTRTRRDLWRTDVAPFRVAVAAAIPAIMTAHVLYRALDPSAPASLSRRIVDGLLRRRLRYKGVVVSDDLEMGAVARRLSPGDAAVQAVAAGTDLLLVCQSLDVAAQARGGIEDAIECGVLDPGRVRDAARRVRRLAARRRPRPAIRTWPVPLHVTLAHSLA